MQSFKRTQGNQGQNQGGWNYTSPSSDGDLSTAQFAAAGLGAATSIFEDADDTLPRMTGFLDNTKNGDGGHKYRGGGNHGSSGAMTASGLWCYRLSGLPQANGQVQRAMTWLRNNYAYDRQANWWQNSYYYYLWASAKGLEVSHRPDGAEGDGNLYAEDVGGSRDPIADGFEDEPRGWYYDFAWQLVTSQSGDGSWPVRRGNGSHGHNQTADSAFAILVLERSLGGVCVDEDEDEICRTNDNCPAIFNPERPMDDGQADWDDDGLVDGES